MTFLRKHQVVTVNVACDEACSETVLKLLEQNTVF